MKTKSFMDKRKDYHRCINPRCDRIVSKKTLCCCACCEYNFWAVAPTQHDEQCNALHEKREEDMDYLYCFQFDQQPERKAEVPFILPKGCS